MSSRIIEAKFQALDRTIRLLNKTSLRAKVSSSDQLRELVYAQQRPQSAVRYSDATTASRKAQQSDDRPHTARKHSPAQPCKNHLLDERAPPADRGEWTESQLDRTQVLLRESWNEIESSVPRRQAPQGERISSSPIQARATVQAEEMEPNERSPRCSTPPISNNQTDDTQDNAAHSRLEKGGASKKVSFGEQKRNQRGSTPETGANSKANGRNWFAPQRPHRPVSTQKKSRKVVPQSDTARLENEEAAAPHPQTTLSESSELIDSPSFYFLEVRLDHPSPLIDWRFRATFTDLSVLPRSSVTVDNVPVDARNCLLFTTASGAPGTSIIIRYFDPVFHFPHVTKPRDLYGHCIRILVHSTIPMQRVVIDTLVHFLVDDGTPQLQPPARALSSYTPTKRDRLSPRKPDKLDLVLSRAKALPMDAECGAWEVHDEDDGHTQRSMASPRSEDEPGASTIDKKRIELKQMRSNMRRKLRDESHQLHRDQESRQVQRR